MLTLLNYPFMQQAVLAALLIGIGLSVAGVLVMLMDVPFLGITMSHAAFFGAVAGLVVGFSPIWGASVACMVAAALTGPLSTRTGGSANAALSIIFTALIGGAFLLIHALPGPRSDALSLIWGSLLTVSRQDLVVLSVLVMLVLVVIATCYRWIMAVLYDRAVARTCGVPAGILHGGLIVLAGLLVSASLPAVGGILIFGLLVNPASAARQLTRRMDRLFFLSACFGVLSCWGGLWISVWFDVPTGPVIVLVSCAIFALACLLSHTPWRRPRTRVP